MYCQNRRCDRPDALGKSVGLKRRAGEGAQRTPRRPRSRKEETEFQIHRDCLRAGLALFAARSGLVPPLNRLIDRFEEESPLWGGGVFRHEATLSDAGCSRLRRLHAEGHRDRRCRRTGRARRRRRGRAAAGCENHCRETFAACKDGSRADRKSRLPWPGVLSWLEHGIERHPLEGGLKTGRGLA